VAPNCKKILADEPADAAPGEGPPWRIVAGHHRKGPVERGRILRLLPQLRRVNWRRNQISRAFNLASMKYR